MTAPLAALEGSEDTFKNAVCWTARLVQEHTLAQLRQMGGLIGFVAFTDRSRGRLMNPAFWESKEALRVTEGAVSAVRSGAAETAGEGMEDWEQARGNSTCE